MNVCKLIPLAVLLCGFCRIGYSQNDAAFKSVSLSSMDAFSAPAKNWMIASDATADMSKPMDLKPVKGEGALINIANKSGGADLSTKQEFADLQVEFDFMTAKGTSAALYMMGRYGLNLADSWTQNHATSADAGGIRPRQGSMRGATDGTPPLMSVSRAPGLWQHISLKFRAPKFGGTGEKITDARFDEVYLNGVLVQQMTSVTGPGAASQFQDEKQRGPLVIQGNSGPIAFKNIRYRELPDAKDSSGTAKNYTEVNNPIIVNPEAKPRLLRGFVQYGDRKLTHVVSYGDPSGINFSYDIKQGAIFQVWRGQFLDVTEMWHERGEPQLAVPLGSVITLSDAPVVATLNGDGEAWPDSVSFDDQVTHGYVLNKYRSPTFMYSIKGVEVGDSISTQTDGEGITRTITVANPTGNAFVRVAASPVIENMGADLYAVNGKSYYIRIDKKFKPVIRQSSKGKELIAKYDAANPFTYSIIW